MNPIIKLSDNAASRIKEIMSSAEKDALGVRVSVKSGGCAGMSYVMEYSRELNPNDEIIEDKGVKVFVDSAAVMYLLGTEMDYKKEELSSSFVFNNPNETERCGCGESFKIQYKFNAYLHCIKRISIVYLTMNKFEFKNLVKNLEKSLKERSFFKNLRKEVNTGANGTQDYVVKKDVNKDTIATTRQ